MDVPKIPPGRLIRPEGKIHPSIPEQKSPARKGTYSLLLRGLSVALIIVGVLALLMLIRYY